MPKCCIWKSFANVLGRNVTANSILWSKIRRFWRKNTSLLMFTKREKYDKLMVTDDEIQRRIRTLRSFVICSAWRECPEATKAVPPYAGWIGSAYWGRSKTSIQDWARRGEARPNLTLCLRLANAFHVSVDTLLEGVVEYEMVQTLLNATSEQLLAQELLQVVKRYIREAEK